MWCIQWSFPRVLGFQISGNLHVRKLNKAHTKRANIKAYSISRVVVSTFSYPLFSLYFTSSQILPTSLFASAAASTPPPRSGQACSRNLTRPIPRQYPRRFWPLRQPPRFWLCIRRWYYHLQRRPPTWPWKFVTRKCWRWDFLMEAPVNLWTLNSFVPPLVSLRAAVPYPPWIFRCTNPTPCTFLYKTKTMMRIWKDNQRKILWNLIRSSRSIYIRILIPIQFHLLPPFHWSLSPSPLTPPPMVVDVQM